MPLRAATAAARAVGRMAEMPVAGAGGVDLDVEPEPLGLGAGSAASASGERQILPRQTNRTETRHPASDCLVAKARTLC